MSQGRTIWRAKDVGWWERERITILGEEFGSAGPAVIDWLECRAKLQNDGGFVKSGVRAVARGCFVDAVTVSHVLSRAVTLGALEEFEERDGLFTCRISGWKSDQDRASASWRKSKQRTGATDGPGKPGEDVTVSHAKSRSVTKCPPTGQDRTVKKQTALSASPTGEAKQVFDAWLASTGRTTRTVLSPDRQRIIRNALKLYPLQDLLDAVDGWRFSPHHRGENESKTVYNDLETLLRSSKQVEKFRDLKRRAPHASPNSRNGHVRHSDLVNLMPGNRELATNQ